MTTLSPPPRRTAAKRPAPPRPLPPSPAGDRRTQRPLVAGSVLAGLLAAGLGLGLCLALGLVGWFLSDGGAHGTTRDGLRVGALGWLVAQRSGVHVEGTPVTAVPLGMTLLLAWLVWRCGLRLGEAVSGHGPDAEALGDGVRDVVVPAATGLFAVGHLTVVVLVSSLAGSAVTSPSTPRAALWSVLVSVLVGGTGIAVGSGRAAVWAARVPMEARVAGRVARRVLVLWTVVALATFVVALFAHLTTAVNVLSDLHADAGAVTLLLGLSLFLLPNAVAFSGSYLLGPGFAVGTGTTVGTAGSVLGPLPAFPMLAALPDQGPAPGWVAALVVVPGLVALVAVVSVLRRLPALRWDRSALAGAGGGLLAALAFGLLAHLSGGSVGPGRMQQVHPFTLDVTVHALTSFTLGGLLGGLLAAWWVGRREA